VKVEMTRVDTEPLGELTVGQLLPALGAEHLQNADPKRMPEGFELFGLVEYERVLHGLPLGQFYI
jgi:hypothetical protein